MGMSLPRATFGFRSPIHPQLAAAYPAALGKSHPLFMLFVAVIVFDDRHCSAVGRADHCAIHQRRIQADRAYAGSGNA